MSHRTGKDQHTGRPHSASQPEPPRTVQQIVPYSRHTLPSIPLQHSNYKPPHTHYNNYEQKYQDPPKLR